MSAPTNPSADQEALYPGSSDDSAYDEANIGASLTSSLRSSIYMYREVHGRTYHAYKDCEYGFPNDELELERLDLQHHVYHPRLDGKLFLAPISATPHNVLDVGTGTGIWAIEIAEMYPSASVGWGAGRVSQKPFEICQFPKITQMPTTFPLAAA
jgi:hypothetical protein